MSKIPPEFTAARALEESFRALGEEQSRARRRRRVPRGTRRTVLIAVTALMIAAVAATGSKVFLGDGGTVGSDPGGVPKRLRQAPPDRQLGAVRTADPVERFPWGLRVYPGASGDTCLVLGRVVSGHLGLVLNGRFSELPSDKPGTCDRLSRQHVVLAWRRYSDAQISGGRTVLYGIVDRSVTALRLTQGGGGTRVAIAADGTFAVVRSGLTAFHHARLTLDGSSGQRVVDLGA